MSNVPMPEPMAEITRIAGTEIFDLTEAGKTSGLTVGAQFITTTQAQAYADARVREVLEEALTVVADEQKSLCDDDHELGWSDCADTIHKNIRALIPTPPTEKP